MKYFEIEAFIGRGLGGKRDREKKIPILKIPLYGGKYFIGYKLLFNMSDNRIINHGINFKVAVSFKYRRRYKNWEK